MRRAALEEAAVTSVSASEPSKAIDGASLMRMAERRFESVAIDPLALDHLYARRSSTAMPRDAWEHEVRVTLAVDRAARSMLNTAPEETLHNLVTAEARAELARQLTAPSGMLVLVYHGGFPAVLRALFADLFPDGIIIGRGGAYDVLNGGFALFAGREALLQGKSVMISPEGGFGKVTGTMDILGAPRVIADGAPFLVHSTDCRTAWFHLARGECGFEPVVIPGPQREDKETFKAFRERFFRFYADQLRGAFTGDPRNLVLTALWAKIFANAARRAQAGAPNA